MTLLDRSKFAVIFAPLAGMRVGLVGGWGNVGDQLIWRGTRQLLNHFGIDWVDAGSTGDLTERIEAVRRLKGFDRLLLFGGGSMGGPYAGPLALRRTSLSTGIPCIVLPQSFFAPEEGPYETVYVREKMSLRLHCPQGVLAPDMALGMDIGERPAIKPNPGVGVFLRRCCEANFTGQGLGDPARIAGSVEGYLHLAASYEAIVTDRCHFAIASLMVGNPTAILPNSYHKNRGLWETWLGDLGCRWADTPEAAIMAFRNEGIESM